MGLFSETVLTQASQVLSLVEDTPDIISPAVMESVFTPKQNMATNIVNNIMHSLGSKVSRFYRYGKDHYTNGLPDGSIGYASVNRDDIQLALEAEFTIGATQRIRQDVAILDRFNIIYFVKETLTLQTNWNEGAGTLNYPTATDPLYSYSFTLNPPVLLSDDSFSILLTDPTAVNPDITATFTISSNYLMDVLKRYYYVSFDVVNADGTVDGDKHYWVYDPTSNDYPDLALPTDTAYTQYLPIVPLRINNVSLTDTAHQSTPLYQTSKKLLQKIDLSIEQLDEGVNGNPDIGDIDHAYVVMAISLHSNKQESLRYLYDYFDDLDDRSTYSYDDFDYWNTTMVNKGTPLDPDYVAYKTLIPPYINEVKISDGTYDTRLVYYYITKTSNQEVIGNVGSYSRIIQGGHSRIAVQYGSTDTNTPLYYHMESPNNKIILKKQVTATTVDIITVSGAIHVNNIYMAEDIITGIEETEEDSFLIPINISISNQYGALTRNTLYYDAMKIVFNAFQYTKLKWYQTSFFQFVMIVVAIAITVFTGGIGSFTGGLVAAASAGAVALAIFVAKSITIALLTKYVFKLAVDIVGVDFAFILAIVAMAYGVAGSEGMLNLPYADIALMASVGTMSGVTDVTMDMLADVNQEAQEFSDYATQANEELIQANKDLNPINALDPMQFFTETDYNLFETPSSYLDRKIASGSINELCLDAVPSFVDNSLLLPPLS